MRLFTIINLVALTSATLAWGNEVEPIARSASASVNYILQPGDLIRVQVFQEPDLDRELRVSKDSAVVLPLIGPVSVDGRTVREVETDVTRRYDADYLVNPHVNITVLQYAPRHLNVMGAVNAPGAVVLPPEEPMTLLDAIARAGGFNRLADRKRVQLSRTLPDGSIQTETIDIKSLTEGGSNRSWFVLPGDNITVPERRM
jgi:polysaccharide biosynthesis/export protein